MVGKLDNLQGDLAHAYDPKAARALADGFGEYAVRLTVGANLPMTRWGFEPAYGALNEKGMMGRTLDGLFLNATSDMFVRLSSNLPGTHEAWRVEATWGWKGNRFRYVAGGTPTAGQFTLQEGVGNDLAALRTALEAKVGDTIGVRLRFAYVEKMSWAMSQAAFEAL